MCSFGGGRRYARDRLEIGRSSNAVLTRLCPAQIKSIQTLWDLVYKECYMWRSGGISLKRSPDSIIHCKRDEHFECISIQIESFQKCEFFTFIGAWVKSISYSCMSCWRWLSNWYSKKALKIICCTHSCLQQLSTTEINGNPPTRNWFDYWSPL